MRKSKSNPNKAAESHTLGFGGVLVFSTVSLAIVALLLFIIFADKKMMNSLSNNLRSAVQTTFSFFGSNNKKEEGTIGLVDDLSQYQTPIIEGSNIRSIAEIRWCLREEIRLKTIRPMINPSTALVYNTMVDNYQARCGEYQYQHNDLVRAQTDVARYQTAIEKQAVNEINGWLGSYQYMPDNNDKTVAENPDFIIKNVPISRANKVIQTDDTMLLLSEVRRQLDRLGYTSSDSKNETNYEANTTEAVKRFQQDHGLEADGKIDKELLALLTNLQN